MKFWGTLFLTMGVSFGVSSGWASAPSKNAKASSEAKSYYLLTDRVAGLLKTTKGIHPEIVGQHDGQTLIRLSLDEVEILASRIHEKFHSCGGFIEVNEPIGKAGGVSAFIQQGMVPPKNFAATQFDVDQIRFATVSRTVIEQVKEDRFQGSLNQLTQFPDRSSRSDNGRRAAGWLMDEAIRYAQALGRDDVSARMIATGSRYTQDSVVVKIAGSTREPGVLVGGHMDTFNNNKPGADDDGTGTISALEIFRAVLDSGVKFKRDIYVVFYAAEEMGLVGSSRVAQTFRDEGIQLRSVLQFDMTGYKSSRETKDIYFIEDNVSLEATRFAEKIALEILNIPADKIGKTRCGYACSDHASWHRQGYGAVFPFESSFNNYNSAIHSSGDTISLLSIPHAMRFVRLGAAFVTELAEPLVQ